MKKAMLLVSLVLTAFLGHADEKKLPDQSIYQLKTVWTNQAGDQTSISNLLGTPQIITMVFTSCEYACPVVVADIKKIIEGLPKKTQDKIQISLFSFDPDKDTPKRLKKFSLKHTMGSNWQMYTSDDDKVRELAAVLGVKYKKMKNGMYTHSNVISIVDQQGLIVHQQIGLHADPATSIQKLKEIAP